MGLRKVDIFKRIVMLCFMMVYRLKLIAFGIINILWFCGCSLRMFSCISHARIRISNHYLHVVGLRVDVETINAKNTKTAPNPQLVPKPIRQPSFKNNTNRHPNHQ